MSATTRTVFLTGSTGFIGQYVLRGLLQREQRVVVMLRGPTAQNRSRLSGIMRPLGVDVETHLRAGQLVITEGTLPHEVPPLDVGGVDQIVHSAACLQTAGTDSGEPFATNFEGVKALARWAETHDVPNFCFVSSAYTCGRDTRLARELFHQPRPRFVTDYELSKWLAEDYLRRWADKTARQLTILRPSLVIGDSVTGYTTQYGGFYQLARMVDLLARMFSDCRNEGGLFLPHRIPASPQGHQNLVTVDFAASAIVAIVSRIELQGEIYHLTNPAPPTNEQVKGWLAEYYQISGGHFVNSVDDATSESLAEQVFLTSNDLVLQQFRFVPEFDCTNTIAALSGTGVSCPKLDRALVFRLLDYARANRWGRRLAAAAAG